MEIDELRPAVSTAQSATDTDPQGPCDSGPHQSMASRLGLLLVVQRVVGAACLGAALIALFPHWFGVRCNPGIGYLQVAACCGLLP